jgi:hypothetical protein
MEEASYNCAYFYAETAGKVAGRMSTTRYSLKVNWNL